MPIRRPPKASPYWPLILGASLTSAALLLAACGGGSRSTTSSTAPGSMAMSLTDGPSTDFANAYVTVKEIMVHPSSTAVDVNASGWITATLPAPITVDLNSLNNGALQAVLSNLSLPAGSYGQIRLILAKWDAPLTSSAQNIAVNGVALAYNDTIVEANGAQYPLEIPYGTQGIALVGNFTVATGQALNLAVEFDVGDDVVRFKHANGYAYTMNPTLHYYDMSAVGAVTGKIDSSSCAATPATANSCFDFVVKAETLSPDGSYYQVTRWTSVKADGTFNLYPLPANGKPYDIMIRGRNAQTIIVKGVPVTAGTTAANGTVLSSTAVPITSATEYTVNTSGVQPSAAQVQFYQTLPGMSAPYEIRFRQTDPFLGNFWTPEPIASGSILAGDYVAGGSPNLIAQTPVEGAGTYQVWFSDPYFTRTAAGTISASTTITGPSIAQGSGVPALGTITGNLVPSVANKWTNGQLVVTRFGRIVNTVDVSSVVAAGGSYAVAALPAGSSTQAFAPGYYYAYLRLWNANAARPDQVKIVEIPGFADLRSTNAAVLNATLP